MHIQTLIHKLIEKTPHHDLTELFEGAASEMMDGAATPVQMAGLLSILRIQGESAHAVASFAKVMRARAMPFQRSAGMVLDTCGTGGDGSGTFNISTAAAFVVAGAGIAVAKHGNRSMSSRCGSADVLTELGVKIDADCKLMEQALAQAGICFLFAQCFHSSMKHVAPVRRELGFRTIFNLVGPLSNPARATHQLIGVFNLEQARLVAQVLQLLEAERAWVVHGEDGLDEISISGATHGFEVRNGTITEFTIHPEDAGLPTSPIAALQGGDAADNARIINAIFDGEEGARKDIVLLNAGAAIHLAGLSPDLRSGVEKARQSLESGEAKRRLSMFSQISHATAEPS